jgi:hypothetical protein
VIVPRFVEHFEHRRIIRKRRRLEAVDAVHRGDRGEPFEQNRPDALAMKLIGHRERGLRGIVAQRDVRPDCDWTDLAVDGAQREETQAVARIARVAEPPHKCVAWLGQREEAAAPRLRREIMKEPPDRVLIGRVGHLQRGRRPVAEHGTKRSLVRGRKCGGEPLHVKPLRPGRE